LFLFRVELQLEAIGEQLLGTDWARGLQKSGDIVYTRGMPWMEANVRTERARFAHDLASGQWSMTELCARFGITRPTGYKWWARYCAGGDAALHNRDRAPHHSPHRVAAEIEAALLAARRHYGWGARKLLQVLQPRHPDWPWPAPSTVNALLARHQLLRKHRRRPHWTHPGAVRLETDHANQVWPADFKGQFKTVDGQYCFPLTVTDHFSRRLMACRGLPSVATAFARPVFRALFREVGLPDAIRTDNGAPFATQALAGLSPLSVWWMQLGIVHQRITPACPQENGQHERMHRELKRETTHPVAHTRRAQQRCFDRFRIRYNEERPHAGIANCTPASRWTPSRRPYPEHIARPEYPVHMEVRRVGSGGTFRLHVQQPYLSRLLAGADIGLEEVGDGIWNIVYYRTLLGRIDERTLVITGVS
jgi:hypothetical protein